MLLGLVAGSIAIWYMVHRWRPRTMTIQGAVIRKDDDQRRQLPIADVEVTATDGSVAASTRSDGTGYFKLIFPESVWQSEAVILRFNHPDYLPLTTQVPTGLRPRPSRLEIAALEPREARGSTTGDHTVSAVTNIKVRYTTNSQTEQNIGSAVRTFQVENRGNQPCNHAQQCSPDGRWKATEGSVSLDAGVDNEFRNIRASCIAGPCPFTRIDASGFAHGGRLIKASALSWSESATFLLEAEVFHLSISSNVRESYPVIFGRALNFTLPPTQEGVSIEADIDGTPMVFPLGPALYLSWATCTQRSEADQQNATAYRCELKEGYKF